MQRINYHTTISELKRILQPQPFLVFITKIQQGAIIQGIFFCRAAALLNAFHMGPQNSNFQIIPGHAALIIGVPEIFNSISAVPTNKIKPVP
jgi:hypothetical protein